MSEGIVGRFWGLVRANASGVLLFAQLLAIMAYPFLEVSTNSVIGDVVLSLLGLLVLAAAIQVVRQSPMLTWLGVLIGIPTAFFTFFDSITANRIVALHWIADGFHIAFYGYTFIGLVAYMFSRQVVGLDEILAIGATFTVAVWLWAYIYSLVQGIIPGSFIAAVNADQPRTWMELLFLSCTTMTSTGLSDIVPVQPHARALVMLQQIAGMLYLAVVVARVVGLTISRQQQTALRNPGPSQESGGG